MGNYKRVSGILRKCKWCDKEFRRYGANSGWSYCSKSCLSAIKLFRVKEKRRIAEETGFIYGIPIKEYFYNRYRKSAISKGREFSLSADDFNGLWQKNCFYCDSSIKTIGIDRFDNSLGYFKGNVVPCCTECNLMKRAMSPSKFIAHCKLISKFHSG